MIDVGSSMIGWNAMQEKPFTRCELECVSGILSGLSNKEIAQQRNTCERTVKLLVSRAYRRVGLPIGNAGQRIQLVRKMLERGWVMQ